MAVKLDDVKVAMGRLIRVMNTKKKRRTEADTYYAVKLENRNGRDERWCLLTPGEVRQLTDVVLGPEFHDPKPGRLLCSYRSPASGTWRHMLRLETSDPDGKIGVRDVVIGDRLLKRAADRATRNPEDTPSTGLLRDLFD